LLFTEHNKSKDSLHPIIYTYKFTHFTIKNKLFLKFLTKRKVILPIPSSLPLYYISCHNASVWETSSMRISSNNKANMP